MKDHIAVLTIAGSDSGGGAGIQADLKAFSALGVFGTSVITAITAQNLSGVTGVQGVDPEIVAGQLRAVLEGFPIKAIKTGMLLSAEIIETIVGVLKDYPPVPLVIDPVFAATSGSKLIRDDAIETLSRELFPLGALITPNMAEAEILSGLTLSNRQDLEKCGNQLVRKFKVPFLMKGGHLPDTASDILCDHEGNHIFPAEQIKDINNHGSGCTYASAIAALLARGEDLPSAVAGAKEYITGALQKPVELNSRTRVINHFWRST